LDIKLQKSVVSNSQSIVSISGSKSETNRLLLLQALYPTISIENASDSDDSEVMQQAFAVFESSIHNQQPPIINVHHAGTAMRFLTAYFAMQEGRTVVLTGSNRMQERPIQILVDALSQLGADIEYLEKEGFPPLKITGKKISTSKVTLHANVSSQYISALLLIAPKLENGLKLILEGEITSLPYIKMTLELLNQIGVETNFEGNEISVNHKSQVTNHQVVVESDWSSASYWYSIVALSEIGTQITLSSYKKHSLQGDRALVEIYKDFGLETIFNEDNSITISKIKNCQANDSEQAQQLSIVNYQLNNCPDIAQTIAVTCFGLGIACQLSGLHTLKIKETDRLKALKTELSKLGAKVSVSNESLSLEASGFIAPNIKIDTYQDHRMAMAFAPLAIKVPIVIRNAAVVSKSYPNFWEDLKKVGLSIAEE
jgi:3-phosphoshikimate 1-carboxyvinyltransferase